MANHSKMTHWIVGGLLLIFGLIHIPEESKAECTHVQQANWPMIPELAAKFDPSNLPKELYFNEDRLLPSSGYEFYTCDNQTWILKGDEVKVRSVKLPIVQLPSKNIIHQFRVCQCLEESSGKSTYQPLILDPVQKILNCPERAKDTNKTSQVLRIQILDSGEVRILNK